MGARIMDYFMQEKPFIEYDDGDLEIYEDFGEDAEPAEW